MKIEGRYEFAAPRQQVWEMLISPEALRSCLPGCKRFDETAPDQYAVTMEIGVAAIKGTYQGKAQLAEKDPPYRYKLIVEGAGGPGRVRGEGVLTLEEQGDGTVVTVDGDAQISGLIASVGQRMIGGVARMMMGQFFECLKAQLPAKA
ncbi:MAG: uncharacterized protein QOF51_3154 [Chloroflexota bacterium]|nr:uncharacterized protein [Chloroflexota bacterium]